MSWRCQSSQTLLYRPRKRRKQTDERAHLPPVTQRGRKSNIGLARQSGARVGLQAGVYPVGSVDDTHRLRPGDFSFHFRPFRPQHPAASAPAMASPSLQEARTSIRV